MKREKVRLAVCTPSGIDVSGKFMGSMLGMQAACLRNRELGRNHYLENWYFLNQRGSLLPMLRQVLVDKAKEVNATHMLFVDSDMVFPRDIIHRWVPLGYPVIAANCATKAIPSCCTARSLATEDEKGKVLETTKQDALQGKIEKVWRVGTGVMLIDMKIFKKVQKPYFPITYSQEHDRFVGEDWNFCKAVEEAGFDIYVDHAVSWEVKHLGESEYGMDLIQMQSFARHAQEEEKKAQLLKQHVQNNVEKIK